MPEAGTARGMRLSGPGRSRARAVPPFWRLGSGAMPPSGPFIALVPGAEAPLLRVSLPDTLKGSAREGVALRQLRDRLGTGAEGLVLRPARFGRRDDGWSAVLAAGQDAVAHWQAQVKAARGRCKAVLPDYLALPAAPGIWTVQTLPGPDGLPMAQARLGPQDGFSAEAPLAALMLVQAVERARAQGVLPAAVLRLGPSEAGVDGALEGLPLFPSVDDLPPGLPRPRSLAHDEAALDLGHDPRAVTEAAQARLLNLRWPLALAVIGLAAWAVATELQTRHMLARADALQAATIDAVRRDFLPSGPLLDIPVQVTRELERRRGAGSDTPGRSGALDLLHTSAERLAASPGALVSLVLQPAGALVLELSLADFATLEQLLDDLRADGLSVSVIRSGTEPEGQVSATVAIDAGGAQ